MKRQFISASNQNPTMRLVEFLLFAIAIKVYDFSSWAWGVWGTLFILFQVIFWYRVTTEEGVDVVRRN